MIAGLTNHLWQSTWFAVAAGLLTVAFRKNRAKVRYWLWFSASFKFFVPFALLMSLGSHLEWVAAAQKLAAPAVESTIVQITQPFPATRGSLDWVPLAVLGVWACGFAAIALIRFRAWLRIRAAVRSSIAIDLAAPLEVRSAAGLLEPGVVGWWRPILLLPAGIAERLTPLQLEAVLAHELCHVRRRDNLFAAIHMVAEATFWFHPLVWWIGARLVEERERACDEEVLSLGNEPRVYAEGILTVCKMYVESPLTCVSGVTGSDLKKRIEAIMRNRIVNRLNLARKLALVAAGMAALAAPVVIGMMHAPAVRAQSVPVTPEEHQRRMEYAKAKFGSAVNAMGRTYVRYGAPDQIDDRGSNAQNPTQIWRYHYLESFHGNVEFEFTPTKNPMSLRINWPPPLATYEGAPGADATLAEALNRETQHAGPPSANSIGGLPGRHASFQMYPAEVTQTLSIPLDSLSGRVDIIVQIRTLLDTGVAGATVATARDFISAAAGTYQTGFTLEPGSYVCHLLAREQATGKIFTEVIQFEVK